MGDPNLIAWLLPTKKEDEGPVGKYSWEAIRMNTPEFNEVSLEVTKDNTIADGTSYPKLYLNFSSARKSSYGLIFGTDLKSCDITLPRLRKISRRHCYLAFDVERRLILRDCSTHGTTVKYNGKGGESRNNFTWIIGGHIARENLQPIVIEIQGVSFQIVVPNHDGNPSQYNLNVDRFMKETNELHIDEPTGRSFITSLSKHQTPNQAAMRIKHETLGKGAFAVVRRYWDVSTGIEYAYKEPLDKADFDGRLWEREANIMKQISHAHVVKFKEWRPTPSPQLVLEYVPSGSLEGLELSLEESKTVLLQALSALVDLHGREAPIVHLDIKPANILLQSRDPLHIKLTDFGFSRASNDLSTFCGTPLYLAPEVHEKKRYTPAVDIWSLGIVIFECAYGHLNSRGYQGVDWCESLVDQVNDCESGDLINFLASAMVVMDPKLRNLAQDCYSRASQLATESYNLDVAPKLPAEGTGLPLLTNAQNTSQHGDSADSSRTSRKRHARSDGLPPSKRRAIIANSSSTSHSAGRTDEIDLFGNDWLQDPNCVGSAIAAMGEEEPSEISNWDEWSTTPSRRNVPRSMAEPVQEQEEPRNPPPVAGLDNSFRPSAYYVDADVQE